MRNRLVPSLFVLMLVCLGTSVRPVFAGGAPFTTLSFPGAPNEFCGSWVANGGGGLATDLFLLIYLLAGGRFFMALASLDAGSQESMDSNRSFSSQSSMDSVLKSSSIMMFGLDYL